VLGASSVGTVSVRPIVKFASCFPKMNSKQFAEIVAMIDVRTNVV